MKTTGSSILQCLQYNTVQYTNITLFITMLDTEASYRDTQAYKSIY